jgi:hypothetical protein
MWIVSGDVIVQSEPNDTPLPHEASDCINFRVARRARR